MEISPEGLDRTLQRILDTRRDLDAAVTRLNELGIDADLKVLLFEREGVIPEDLIAEVVRLEEIRAAIASVTNAARFLRSYPKAFGEGLSKHPFAPDQGSVQ